MESKPLWKSWPFRITFIVLAAGMAFCIVRVMALEKEHPGALKAAVEDRFGVHS